MQQLESGRPAGPTGVHEELTCRCSNSLPSLEYHLLSLSLFPRDAGFISCPAATLVPLFLCEFDHLLFEHQRRTSVTFDLLLFLSFTFFTLFHHFKRFLSLPYTPFVPRSPPPLFPQRSGRSSTQLRTGPVVVLILVHFNALSLFPSPQPSPPQLEPNLPRPIIILQPQLPSFLPFFTSSSSLRLHGFEREQHFGRRRNLSSLS